jgi:Na+/H+ antiporter NhaD/arsenite permease-like protein
MSLTAASLPLSGPGALPLWSAIPFVVLLLCVAALPLLAPKWWHSNRNRAIISFSLGLPVAVFVAFRDPPALIHTILDYVAFIALLGALYIISGNICFHGTLPGTPGSNTFLLALGAVLTNVAGTTGAAMLLIRPFLKANHTRSSRVHLVVFFILIVANCGGCLTPLGDPPLFLGFLRGVPFQWTLGLWKEWAFVLGGLLLMFYLWDRRRYSLEGKPEAPRTEALRIEGTFNFLLLSGVIATVLASGFWIHPRFGEAVAQIAQAAIMGALALVSLWLTPRAIREENEFSWHPLVEVVVLFAGIFAAMIPALSILSSKGPSLGVAAPWHYFVATGVLSAFLDNAPTYLAFLSLAQHLPDEVAGTTSAVLQGISCGAVFFGALTYIGNGPNFMVKAIAEHSGIRMPSFFGYLGWALAVLSPLLAAVAFLFLR